MDPFENSPYPNESEEDDLSSWRSRQAAVRALMKADLEISPLVQVVPALPDSKLAASVKQAPGIPRSFGSRDKIKAGGGRSEAVGADLKDTPSKAAHQSQGEVHPSVRQHQASLPAPAVSAVHNRPPERQQLPKGAVSSSIYGPPPKAAIPGISAALHTAGSDERVVPSPPRPALPPRKSFLSPKPMPRVDLGRRSDERVLPSPPRPPSRNSFLAPKPMARTGFAPVLAPGRSIGVDITAMPAPPTGPPRHDVGGDEAQDARAADIVRNMSMNSTAALVAHVLADAAWQRAPVQNQPAAETASVANDPGVCTDSMPMIPKVAQKVSKTGAAKTASIQTLIDATETQALSTCTTSSEAASKGLTSVESGGRHRAKVEKLESTGVAGDARSKAASVHGEASLPSETKGAQGSRTGTTQGLGDAQVPPVQMALTNERLESLAAEAHKQLEDGNKPVPARDATKEVRLETSKPKVDADSNIEPVPATTQAFIGPLPRPASCEVSIATAVTEPKPVQASRAKQAAGVDESKSAKTKPAPAVTEKKKQAPKRKAPARPVKKVLVAKKEKEQATAFLRDKNDLLNCLARDECFFLARQFWIFTAAQLLAVLQPEESFKADETNRKKAQACRDAILKALLDSDLIIADAQAAESRLADWLGKLKQFQSDKATPSDRAKCFPLDGPISCLFPEATRNFLDSVSVKDLKGFLSLKKTETGAICDMLKIWRRECGLSSLPPLALAKHLFGSATRAEAALAASPPVDRIDRKWMDCPLIQLTGAAREFLIDFLKFNNTADFLNHRTRELALQLAEWREKKGQVPLKGSGKVAMISAWKAAVREGIEAEAHGGKRFSINELDLQALAEKDVPIVIDETRLTEKAGSKKQKGAGPDSTLKKEKAPKLLFAPQPTKKRKPPPAAADKQESKTGEAEQAGSQARQPATAKADRQVQYALSTTLFLEDVLGEVTTKLLTSVGIATAADLLNAKLDVLSQLYVALIAEEHATDDGDCEQLVTLWCDKIREELDMLRGSPPPSKKAKTVPETKVDADATKAKQEQSTKKSSNKEKKAPRKKEVRDPTDALSSVTRRFLVETGIGTAREFLAKRTTDVANDFIKWRAKEGMSELKGLGAIASVSGWKATCRRIAREMGMGSIAVVEPTERNSWGPHSRELSKSRAPHVKSEVVANQFPGCGMPGDKDSKFFAFCDTRADKQREYQFELSLRNPGTDCKGRCLVVTYKGVFSNTEAVGTASMVTLATPPGAAPSSEEVRLSVLQLSTADNSQTGAGTPVDSQLPFVASGAGMGLIELPDLRQVRPQPLESLKEMIRMFVLEGKEVDSESTAPRMPLSGNIILHRQTPKKCSTYIYVAQPLERGQALTAQFPLVGDYLRSGLYKGSSYELRHLIGNALFLLSSEDQAACRRFLEAELLDATGYNKVVLAAGDGSSDEYSKACGARQRLHWVGVSLLRASGSALEPSDKLYFGSSDAGCAANDSQPDQQPKSKEDKDDGSSPQTNRNLQEALESELRKELEHALDFTDACRKDWCPLFVKSFEAGEKAVVRAAWRQNPRDTGATLKASLVEVLCLPVTDPEELTVSKEGVFAHLLHVPLEGAKRMFVVCKSSTAAEDKATEDVVTLRSVEDVESGNAAIHVSWYREMQWKILTTILETYGSLHDSTLAVDNLMKEVKHAAAAAATESLDTTTTREESSIATTTYMPVATGDDQQPMPNSYQLFLTLVWPCLRKLGWRLEYKPTAATGAYAQNYHFIAPEDTGNGAGNKKRSSSQQKQLRNLRKLRLSRRANGTGLGCISKPAKRLVVAIVPKEGDSIGRLKSKSKSARVVMEGFVESIALLLQNDDSKGHVIAKQIGDALLECTQEMSGLLLGSSSSRSSSSKTNAEHLLQCLTILPDVLRQSGLELQEINDTLEIVQEVFAHVASPEQWKALFDERRLPPPEEYALPKKNSCTSLLASRLRHLHTVASAEQKQSSNDDAVLTEILLEEDKVHLTDFLVAVLEQSIPCRATELDVKKKFRRIHVGFPGFACRHCHAKHNLDGRYFFTTIESMATASTVFEKHLLKCPNVPTEIRDRVVNTRVYHPDQRKLLKTGSQQSFFNRLWDRLRSAKIKGVETGHYTSEVLLDNTERTTAQQKGGATLMPAIPAEERLSFSNHLALLDYLRNSSRWNSKTVRAALGQYYGCLEFGGRVLHTSAMPAHLNTAWILQKIAPAARQVLSSSSKPSSSVLLGSAAAAPPPPPPPRRAPVSSSSSSSAKLLR